VTCADCVGTGTDTQLTEVVRTGTAVDVACPFVVKIEYEDVVKMLVLGDGVSLTESDKCTSFPNVEVAADGALVRGVCPVGCGVLPVLVNWIAGGATSV